MERQNKQNYIAWQWNPRNYPQNESIEEKIAFFVSAGILAANIHNTQPWQFHIKDNTLKVSPEETYSLLYADPVQRGLYISLGCSVKNIEAAAAYQSMGVEMTTKKENGREHMYLRFYPQQGKEKKIADLSSFISKRHSNKAPYRDRPVDPDTLDAFKTIKTGNNVKVVFTDDRNVIHALGELQKEAVMNLKKTEFGRELSSWLRPNNTNKYDGMPGFVVGLNLAASYTAIFGLRYIRGTLNMLAKKDKLLLSSSPLVGVVVAHGDNKRTWIDAGRVFEETALTAAKHGANLTPMQGAVEDEQTADTIRHLFNLGNFRPQMLLRIGYSTRNDVLHTPRKKLKMVIH